MPSFILTATDQDGTVTTKTFDSEFLGDTAEKVEDFLHGVGFCFEELTCKFSDDHIILTSRQENQKPFIVTTFVTMLILVSNNTAYST